MKKRRFTIRAKIHAIPRDGARQPAVEPPEVLLMMETLSRWVNYDHRHKTFLSKELLWIAARLIGLRADATHWRLEHTWPEKAFWMGIDLKYFTVTDPVKFGWFWWQVGETGRFDIKKQKELINSKKIPPEIEPLLLTKPYWTPKVKSEKQRAEAVKEHQDEHIKREIMDHFFV